MLKRLLKDFVLLLLVLLAVLINLLSRNALWIEQHYTNGIYPYLASAQRALLGWMPFSFGDLLYAAAGLYFIYLLYIAITTIRAKGFSKIWLWTGIVKCLKILLIIYVWFNALWGLNYNRLGIAHQLGLEENPYTLEEVSSLARDLQQRLNFYAARVDTVQREREKNRTLFASAYATYQIAQIQYPYFHYPNPTVKPSLYSGIGHYFGFTGYYNPFTGEAQIKTTIPSFVKPFVILHEIAHQVGYAKENEANFVAFLAGKHATGVADLYSVYYNAYRYAAREVAARDTALYNSLQRQLHPRVLIDNQILRAYLLSAENKIEPLVTLFYDRFLKVNNQAEGVQTYNRVVGLLVAYRKKRGPQAL